MSDTPLEEGASPAPPEGQEEASQQPRDEQGRFQSPDQPNHDERRWARLTGRMAVLARERDEMAARLAAVERAQLAQVQATQGPQPQLDPQVAQWIEQQAEAKVQARELDRRIRDFHATGAEQYPDWQKRCQDLQAMGADAQIAALLVDMPNGAKVAGSLRDDPEELEKIALIDTERGRAVALGQYAAKLAAEPTRGTSRAPRPPPPLQGRSSPAPNPYTMQTTKDLVNFFKAEELKKRSR